MYYPSNVIKMAKPVKMKQNNHVACIQQEMHANFWVENITV
jgi:hypothetical protein